jgi:hypothetical protein
VLVLLGQCFAQKSYRLIPLQQHYSNAQITSICLLTVYFGTPSMFITLWFGFDYGTNPPLGTLII